MQVWELMAMLAEARANTVVNVGLHSTLNSADLFVHVSDDGCDVTITGGDVQVIDENGNECGLLSEFSEVEDEELA